MASMQNIEFNRDKRKGENDNSHTKTRMFGEQYSTPVNKTTVRETYWFAHNSEDVRPSNSNTDSKQGGENKDTQLQKDKEERARVFRELQEGERRKKLRDLESHFLQARKHREQQEEERRQKIEEARVKETERRHQVEERKRQIWEAEQERKEAILRRNMDREARIEARRNAQRNAQSFAFGSSTPRTFDLDLAAIGIGRNSVLMSSVSGRKSEERDIGPPRATSACSLDRKFGEDCMSRSMVSLSSSAFRGRRRTDITPTYTRERSVTPHTGSSRGNPMRAVSMTRLDQLAQPRRTYCNPGVYAASPITINGPRAVSPSLSRSMFNLNGRHPITTSKGARSAMHQNGSPLMNQSPTSPQKSSMRSAQSMVHLAVGPRLTRTARLRQEALAGSRAASAWNLNKVDNYHNGRYLSPGKDYSRSPSRPQSSMSGTSDMSASMSTSSSISAVNMRPRPPPRRPRPFSVHGSLVSSSPTEQKNTNTSAPVIKHKENGVSQEREGKVTKHLSAPKKPVPPPKSSKVLAKAKSNPVSIKDNLRKTPRSMADDAAVLDKKDNATLKLMSKSDTKLKIEKKMNGTSDPQSNLLAKTPSTDSEVLPSLGDSRNNADLESPIQISITPTEDLLGDSIADDLSESLAISEEKDISNSETSSVPDKSEKLLENVTTLAAESPFNEENVISVSKSKITSEEEARIALAEKRRLAREQAEKEAELERQRLEKLRIQEEERKQKEEELQRQMEEEQLHLLELHRKMEKEKLQKAIEEQQQKEREEQEKKMEVERQKVEKDEQERKAREEAERQRLELQEKLRKEEEERAERKKRVEQIMARTRGKTIQSPSSQSDVIANLSKSVGATSSNPDPLGEKDASVSDSPSKLSNGIKQSTSFNITFGSSVENNLSSSASCTPEGDDLPDVLRSNGKSGNESSKMNTSNSYSTLVTQTLSANTCIPPRTNGYGSHEEMSCTTSPEENAEMDLLVDIHSVQQKPSFISTDHAIDNVKLVEQDSPFTNLNNENFLIDIDNSNLLQSANLFAGGFEETLQKKQDTAIVDLLS